jgi:hypothetical protein
MLNPVVCCFRFLRHNDACRRAKRLNEMMDKRWDDVSETKRSSRQRRKAARFQAGFCFDNCD